MNKKIPLGITIGLMAITAAITFIVTSNLSLDLFNQKLKSVSEKQELYSKLSEIDTYIRAHCLGELDEAALIDGMVSGYINGLGDAYAEYITAEESARRAELETGVVVSLGFDYEKGSGGYISVTYVEPDSPADNEGIVAGDVITAVNNTDVIAYEGGYDEAVKQFDCDEGTVVKLYVRRTDEEYGTSFISYSVTAEKSERITVTGRLIGSVGYIRITSFNDKTESQLKQKLDELISAGALSLIFDVRGCTGTNMSALQASLDHILGAGDIVKAYYPDGTVEAVVTCTEAEKLSMPMSIIVNQTTADCGELFAFALRDNAGAQCVGKVTAGHGYLRSSYKCSDGSVIIFAAAVLQTAGSADFDGDGLHPQYDVTLPSDVDINNISYEAQLMTDTQLIKALEITAAE